MKTFFFLCALTLTNYWQRFTHTRRDRKVIVSLITTFTLCDQLIQPIPTANNGVTITGNVEPLLSITVHASSRVLVVGVVSNMLGRLTFS